MPPLIAFLTDFGTADHYVGAMKGVALGICPDAALVDITHGVTPQDVLGGALALAAAYSYFPQGTVFVAVVDPGVGSSRRALAAEAGGFTFVAPDNGLLTCVLSEQAPSRVVALTEARYARMPVSRTFEGRDRFAPAAAWLARGVDIAALGPAVEQWQVLAIPAPHVEGNQLHGEVLRIDRFGNLITNITRAAYDRFAQVPGTDVKVGPRAVGSIVDTYATAPAGTLCALFGSGDHLEIAVTNGSAAEHLGAGRGTPVTVTRAADQA